MKSKLFNNGRNKNVFGGSNLTSYPPNIRRLNRIWRHIYFLFLFLLFLPYVSAVPINLYNLSINVSNEWCFNESNMIMINATDINNQTVNVDNIFINLSDDNIIYRESVVYQNSSNNIYYIYVRPERMNNSNETTETFNLSVIAFQNGKSINKIIEINLNDCSSDLYDVSQSIDKWLIDNWEILTACISLIIITFVIIYFSEKR